MFIFQFRDSLINLVTFANFFSGHFADINFRELGFTEDFTVKNFRELSLTKESALCKDFPGVNLTFALINTFPTTLVYGFENNLSKNYSKTSP